MPPPKNTIRKAMICSFVDQGNKKTALRRFGNRLPPPLLRGRSHQPGRAVSGDSIPIDYGKLTLQRVKGKNMQMLTMLGIHNMRKMISMAATVATILSTYGSVWAEPARKMS